MLPDSVVHDVTVDGDSGGDRSDPDVVIRDLRAERSALVRQLELAESSAAAEVTALTQRVDELTANTGALGLTVAALEQTSFERERLVAWYSHELARAKFDVSVAVNQHATAAAEAERLAAAIANRPAPSKLAERIARVLWRLGLPFRAMRRPRTYLRILLRR